MSPVDRSTTFENGRSSSSSYRQCCPLQSPARRVSRSKTNSRLCSVIRKIWGRTNVICYHAQEAGDYAIPGKLLCVSIMELLLLWNSLSIPRQVERKLSNLLNDLLY